VTGFGLPFYSNPGQLAVCIHPFLFLFKRLSQFQDPGDRLVTVHQTVMRMDDRWTRPIAVIARDTPRRGNRLLMHTCLLPPKHTSSRDLSSTSKKRHYEPVAKIMRQMTTIEQASPATLWYSVLSKLSRTPSDRSSLVLHIANFSSYQSSPAWQCRVPSWLPTSPPDIRYIIRKPT